MFLRHLRDTNSAYISYNNSWKQAKSFCFQNSPASLDLFQELLDKNPGVFHQCRSAKALRNHWLCMRQYQLLSDQTGSKIIIKIILYKWSYEFLCLKTKLFHSNQNIGCWLCWGENERRKPLSQSREPRNFSEPKISEAEFVCHMGICLSHLSSNQLLTCQSIINLSVSY